MLAKELLLFRGNLFVYEEDFISLLRKHTKLSICEGIYILNSLRYDSKDIFENKVGHIFKKRDVQYDEKMVDLIFSLKFKIWLNSKRNEMVEQMLIGIVDSATYLTSGKVKYTIQAQNLIYVLSSILLSDKEKEAMDIYSEDERVLKKCLECTLSKIEDAYPKFKERVEYSFSDSNWITEKLYFSYMNEEEIIHKQYVENSICNKIE